MRVYLQYTFPLEAQNYDQSWVFFEMQSSKYILRHGRNADKSTQF